MTSIELVTIIIPTYNRVAMLHEAIDSVLQQDYPNKRIIVVDDGSTDNTFDACSEYLTTSANLSYLHKSNGGCSSARNFGLDHLLGDEGFVGFLDSDDKLLPGAMTRMVNELTNSPHSGFCYSDSIVFDEVRGFETLQKSAAPGRPDDFPLEHFLTNEAKSASILYRSRILKDKRFREDLMFSEDSEFLQRIALEYKAVYCEAPGSWVRWHNGSKSRNTLQIYLAVFRSSQDILQKYPEFYQAHKDILDKKLKRMQWNLFCELLIAGMEEDAAIRAITPLQRLVSSSGKSLQAIYLLPFKLRSLLRAVWVRWFR